jgi:hypothetical protein
VESKREYNFLTKIVREEINKLKNRDWGCFIKKQGANPLNTKPFWQKINTLRGKAKSNSIPKLLKDNNRYEIDDEEANLFADILKNTFCDTNDAGFDSNFKDKVESVINNHDFSKHNYSRQSCFTLNDFNDFVKNLQSHSAPVQDGIHNQMLKNASVEFKKILLKLINLTVSKSHVPNSWKMSRITMIPKKKANSSDPKDYRPISLAKLAEKMIANKLKDFLSKNNIIIKQQSGFRAFRQTKDNIFFITQKTIEQFNRRKKVCGIFFDIAAAFDKRLVFN